MKWNDVKKSLPEFEKEVLVWVHGHRGPSWCNHYARVAYLNSFDKEWYEYNEREPIGGIVVKWAKINKPK